MKRLVVVLAVIGLLTIGVWGEETLEVVFLPVGHGNCTLLDCGYWEITVDAGCKKYWADFVVCRSILAPLISPPIETFVLTHWDRDHYGAFETILEEYGITSLWRSEDHPDEASVQDDLAEWERSTCTRFLAHQSPSQSFTSGCLVWEVLHPLHGCAGDDDDMSLVLKATYGNVVFLFTGDIHGQASASDSEACTGTQNAVMQRYPDGCTIEEEVVVLMLPHHASEMHFCAELIKWAKADVLIAACQEDEFTIREDLETIGIPYYITGEERPIVVRTDGTCVRVYLDVSEVPPELTLGDCPE
ncbi:hypothetical protein JW848_10320 [Candidatus Bipolaricaulota bacterium]|nr:hypothetical protein [Candidatus Bipolaricaulota bacterium]